MSGIVSRDVDGRDQLDRATAHLDPPFAVVRLTAFDANARDLVRRADGVPVRVVSKSLRCRYLVERALARPGYRGVMSYALAEPTAASPHDHVVKNNAVPSGTDAVLLSVVMGVGAIAGLVANPVVGAGAADHGAPGRGRPGEGCRSDQYRV